MRSRLSFFYKWLIVLSQQRPSFKGFTLIELLISLVMASLVIAGLLFVVVDLATIDRREANLDQVQRDMNRAMNYITNDLQEAVYVYTNPQAVRAQLTADPSFPDAVDEVPVLAFWRIDPIEQGLPPCTPGPGTNSAADAIFEQCQLLGIRQAAYTLVVYVQKANDGNSNWPGQSRIIRYELSKYDSPIPNNLATRAGYRDPTDLDDAQARFEDWESDGDPRGVSSVLVDYIQAPVFAPPVPLNRAPLSDPGGECSSYGQDSSGTPLYEIVPPTASTTVQNTFFACVRRSNIEGDVENRGNQDVYVFLRGNVQGVSGGVRGYSDRTSLPILETQVLVKGVIQKGYRE